MKAKCRDNSWLWHESHNVQSYNELKVGGRRRGGEGENEVEVVDRVTRM
jgi:hypothetical protein